MMYFPMVEVQKSAKQRQISTSVLLQWLHVNLMHPSLVIDIKKGKIKRPWAHLLMFLWEIYENRSSEPLSFLMPLLLMTQPLAVSGQHVNRAVFQWAAVAGLRIENFLTSPLWHNPKLLETFCCPRIHSELIHLQNQMSLFSLNFK